MLEFYSVKELNCLSRKREIWCWGLGKRFHEMLALYKGEPFMRKITALIDKRSALWETVKEIEGKTLFVEPFQLVKERWNQRVFFLITSDAYSEIYRDICSAFHSRKVDCCLYPRHYYSYTKFLLPFFRLFPLKRRLLFYAGNEPHENALAIVDYLQKEYKGKPYGILFAGQRELDEGRGLKGVSYIKPNMLRLKNSFPQNIRCCYLLATSRFLLYENQPLKKIRKKQKLIYMNHGTIPLKNVRDVLKQPDEVDFCICPSQGCAEIYEEQYSLPAEKHIYCMLPRMVYIKQRPNNISKLFPTEGRKVLLWLPTFRTLAGAGRRDASNTYPIPLFQKKDNIMRINKTLQLNGQLLCIKMHPREQERLEIPEKYENIKILTDEELRKAGLTLQEILGDTAALLTDYSGIAFEYLLLDKPVGYVISDMNHYNRGFAFDNPFDYMPGERIERTEELVIFLDHVKDGADAYREARLDLKNRLFQGNELKNGASELIHFLDRL